MTAKQLCLYGEYGLLAVLALTITITAYRGLISGRLLDLVARVADGRADPVRLQALAIIVGVAAWYLSEGLKAAAAPGLPTELPDVPTEVLTMLGASLGVQLGGKAVDRRTP